MQKQTWIGWSGICLLVFKEYYVMTLVNMSQLLLSQTVRKSLSSSSPNDPEIINMVILSFKVGKIKLECAITMGNKEYLQFLFIFSKHIISGSDISNNKRFPFTSTGIIYKNICRQFCNSLLEILQSACRDLILEMVCNHSINSLKTNDGESQS